MPEQQQVGLTLHALMQVLRRRLGIVLLCVVLVPASALAVSFLQQKQYTATASLLFRDPALDQKLFGSSFVERSTDPAREAATNVELVSLDEMAERTANVLNVGMTGTEVSESTEVKAEGESNVVSIAATVPNANLAARLANTFAQEYVAFRREADRSKIRDAQRLVEADLGDLLDQDRRGRPGQELRRRLGQLGVLASLQTGNAELVQPAEVPEDPSSPQPVRNGVLGLALGALLGLGLALLLDRLDRRLRDTGEVEEAFERPILAAVHESRGLRDPGTGLQNVSEREREAFRMLRANLRYFSISRDIRSVLVTSSGPGDGKSTVAWNLAVAGATAGSRTLLIEADLRHPSFGNRYGFASRWGLTSVLTGEVDHASAVQSVPLPTASTRRDHTHAMDVLLAGPLPPNPTDLVESQRMADVLRAAEADYDLVVIDTPPTAIVSDAIPLITMVGGVIVVSRLGKSTRDSSLHLRHQLENLDAPVLGAVVNFVDKGDPVRVWYGYGYEPAPASVASPNGSVAADRPAAPAASGRPGGGPPDAVIERRSATTTDPETSAPDIRRRPRLTGLSTWLARRRGR